MKRWRYGRGKSVFQELSNSIGFSDGDTHIGARKNSGNVEPAKKAPISSKNLSSTPEDSHYDILMSIHIGGTLYEIIRLWGWSEGDGLGIGHDIRRRLVEGE